MLTTYFEFAENDRGFFLSSSERDEVWNWKAILAHECCEKYLKHIIKYRKPVLRHMDQVEQDMLLQSHNLLQLHFSPRESCHWKL